MRICTQHFVVVVVVVVVIYVVVVDVVVVVVVHLSHKQVKPKMVVGQRKRKKQTNRLLNLTKLSVI